MTMLDEAKPNGHAGPATPVTDTRLARIERRLGEIAETGEQRVAILRDAMADFAAAELAQRDEEIASLKNRIADLEHRLEQKTAVDQQVAEIATRLEERQARRDTGKNGITDGDFIQTMTMVIAQERQSARDEFKAADEEMQRALETKLAALEERLKSVPGRLPVSKIWSAECVTYEGEFVCYDGALYQARKDTAQVPSGSDWVCVAPAGRDGCDGLTPNVCGTYDARKTYERLDIVAFDGAAFVAQRDNPGICPGEGWQLMSRQGRSGGRGERGEPGPRGPKGDKGDAAPAIVSWQIASNDYVIVPFLSDGTAGPKLDLRPLFERYLIETSSA
jgi:hypothetical protein